MANLLNSICRAVTFPQAKISFVITIILIALLVSVVDLAMWSGTYNKFSVNRWAPQPIAVGSKKTPGMDLGELLRANLFGFYSERDFASVAKPNVKDAPKTRLKLILVGAVVSSKSERSLAVISNHKNQSTYGVGEVIDGTKAKLKAVLADRVVIDNEGRDEILTLEGV